MKGNNKITRILSDINRGDFRKRRKEEISSLTAEYQFGFYVGEDIINRYLPTTSVDYIRTNKRIETTKKEYEYHKKLTDIWFNDQTDENWKRLNAEWKRLSKKYLPKELVCYMAPLNIRNEAEFKTGLIASLWDSDVCHYSLDPKDIIIETEDNTFHLFTIIKFKYKD